MASATTTDVADRNPAFVLRAIRDVSFEDRPVPKLRDDYEVRVHVAQTGICGSDVHYWQRGRIGDFILTSPIILGHESSGTVVEAGSKVTNLKVGDRVAIEPGVPCRRCDYCRAGTYNLCNDTIFAATPPWDGTLAKYYTVASDYCYKIPDHMDMEEAAMVEPVSVAVQICKVADLRSNQTVVVFGAGPIGVLSQAVARASGARKVIAVDISKARLDFARSYAADETFLPPALAQGADPVVHSEKVAAMIKDQFGLGEGADVVLECTGAEPCIQAGVFVARKGGTYVQAGMGKENVTFPITTACIRALTIKGSIRYSVGCYPTAVDLVASGKVDVKRLITNRFKFEEAEKAFELVKAAQEGVFKVIIEGVQG
ncbi:GroES-like protein [Polyplosphaeria fusca]|uniref:D-xylulose reductase n=1 Tax=Polyplosphaeria fusca TaxID=682080 RepID=A0A9P4QP35_9PLEO|nr:GroES-like protein [Polyplosphaeria fusca]